MSLSIADSKAVFQRRVREVGLGDKLETIKKLGFETHSDLGFAFNFTPGGSEEAFQVTLVDPILGEKTDTNTQAKKPALRKLHFESYTIAMQDVQNRTVKTDEETRPSKLPVPEREARMAELQEQITGIKFEGELEPSYTLIDKFHTMRVAGELKHMKWEHLTTRESEVGNETKIPFVKADQQGYLRQETTLLEEDADLGSELRLKNALHRRSVGLHIAKLCSFDVHEQLVAEYFRLIYEKPVEGYRKVSIAQIHVT